MWESGLWLLQCQPTFISLIAYFGYWFIIFAILLVKWKQGSLTDAEFKRKRRERKRRKKLGLPPVNADEEEEINAAKVTPSPCSSATAARILGASPLMQLPIL